MSSSWVYFGFQPRSVSIFAELAIKTEGSPGRRGSSSTGIGCPVTRRADSTTSRTEKAMSVAQVVNHPVSPIERLKGQQMRLGQIRYVDVVANAGAVRRWVVLAKNLDALSPARERRQE